MQANYTMTILLVKPTRTHTLMPDPPIQLPEWIQHVKTHSCYTGTIQRVSFWQPTTINGLTTDQWMSNAQNSDLFPPIVQLESGSLCEASDPDLDINSQLKTCVSTDN